MGTILCIVGFIIAIVVTIMYAISWAIGTAAKEDYEREKDENNYPEEYGKD